MLMLCLSLSCFRQRFITILLDSSFFVCVCVAVLRPSQPNGIMSSAVSLPSHTFTGQA